MSLKLKIFTNLLIIFLPFEILEIKAHNIINVGCNDNCSTIIMKKGTNQKIKFLKKNEKLKREQYSCVNNSLCRG